MKNITISTKNASLTNNGIFDGWGTSLCWWANRVGFSRKLTEESARLFFSPEGLDMNIMRYNIGGGDDPAHNHITRTDSEMPGWWKYCEKSKSFVFNPDTDKNQLNVLHECYEAAGKNAYVEAFSNSPPYYMTVSGCTSGNKNPAHDNLKECCVKDFAEYLTRVCVYIQNEHKIKIRSLAPMNEPFSNYWHYMSGKQEGCFVSPGKMQSAVIEATADAIKEHGLTDLIVTACDDTNTVNQYISLKMLNDNAVKNVGRISTHTYAQATPHVGILARSLGKNIWMDESDWSGTAGENSGEMGPALWLCEKIIEDISTIDCSAWVIWQIIAAYISTVPDSKGRLDMPCIPDCTQGFWGTAFADIDNEKIYLTQKYFAFGQFTRYIRPGMTIIHTKDAHSLAAIDKKSGKLVIVTVNTKEVDEQVTFSIDGTDIAGKTASCFRTSGDIKNGEHWSQLPEINLHKNALTISLKGNSVTTFVIK